jgi:hypothetical protein
MLFYMLEFSFLPITQVFTRQIFEGGEMKRVILRNTESEGIKTKPQPGLEPGQSHHEAQCINHYTVAALGW